ncbi:beta-lactamase hydrolase domain-containing protein [Nodosilinea nodulosa]|uniref:beta-lactamase hydrolase domain-containing protein n=1 Tax=Nodosilinea nodulosa TaxID=416001 RepID=UPI0002F65336|nr:protein tyrosine phosphatase family protein [Nodosilinea nodulosa]
MDFARTVNADVAVANCQLSPEQIQQVAEAGYKAVLNLRSPQEDGTLTDEQAQVEAAGLSYINIPVQPNNITPDLIDQVLQALDGLPKPVMTHCRTGLRAGSMVLMHQATRNGMDAETALATSKENGFDWDAQPQFKQVIEQYIDSH